MSKNLIIEAWAKYRPSSIENTPFPQDLSPVSPKRRNVVEIYGDEFLQKLLKGVKSKKQSEGGFKNEVDKILVDNGQDDGEESDNAASKIPDDELQLIEEFLDKFIFTSGSSTSKENINLNLALKALPQKVDESNIYRIDLINFKIIQKSLIAFQNDD